MNELPTLATFSQIVADPRFLLGVGIAVLSGAVRGFSGFGSALIYVPLMSAVYGPKIGAVTFLLVDFVTGLAFVASAMRQANWREVIPIAVFAIAAAQFGTLILQYAEPTTLRWLISITVLVIVPVLASGWRYTGKPHVLITIGVGILAGLLGGAVQISGPPVLIYWLGSPHGVNTVRANFIAYFFLFAIGLVVTYFFRGLLTANILALTVLFAPLHILAMWGGTKLFHLATEKTYRRVAYVIVLLAGLAAMPIFDAWLR
ncbi:sulfite exporter TauE/SafE [Variibacter gotjawalensis]|uniref:Probable membrane transporter protein n=1 Tax=Variibacter gotjawalensis TaxID=1333996 RepID=A0A0S3Q0G5_9BRAD|nr:sulfite exporter TauE/SafE family protein [Variibacter gotjawalensis]NIK47515.1 hypothetical protein [Variibacter gotjawalensis]RZS49411.1 hypothetical protein EV661_1843 [Variibacter gotjawalensis]BAT61674.1 sulfite exporter TauE/SafE [Variibacter gotjawalensis]